MSEVHDTVGSKGEEDDRVERWATSSEGGGGDPVCWAHLVCPECGAIAEGAHRSGCQLGGSFGE